ncbi:hypothetical protein ACGC1H_007479 [Rhizoctonia solani]
MGGGTLRWMAPELLLDEEPPQRNLKTDIYALGMVSVFFTFVISNAFLNLSTKTFLVSTSNAFHTVLYRDFLQETITNAHPYSECRHDHQIYRRLSRKEHPQKSGVHFPDNDRRMKFLNCSWIQKMNPEVLLRWEQYFVYRVHVYS